MKFAFSLLTLLVGVQLSHSESCCNVCTALVDYAMNYPFLDLSSASSVESALNSQCGLNTPSYDKVCNSPFALTAIAAGIVQTQSGLDNSWVCYLMNFCPDRCECECSE